MTKDEKLMPKMDFAKVIHSPHELKTRFDLLTPSPESWPLDHTSYAWMQKCQCWCRNEKEEAFLLRTAPTIHQPSHPQALVCF